MIEIKQGKDTVAEGGTFAEALVRLQDKVADKALLYPTADGSAVHMRVKDKYGEYLKVEILKVTGSADPVEDRPKADSNFQELNLKGGGA